MKQATCYLHGLNLQPHLCADCSRCTRLFVKPLVLEARDRGALGQTRDGFGKVSFKLLRPIAVPEKLDPWADAR